MPRVNYFDTDAPTLNRGHREILFREEADRLEQRNQPRSQMRSLVVEQLSLDAFEAIQALYHMARTGIPVSLVGDDREKVVRKVGKMLGREIPTMRSDVPSFEKELIKLFNTKEFFVFYPMDVYNYSCGPYNRLEPMLANRLIHLRFK